MLLSPEGSIARRLPGFESRPQQAEMAALVERAFETRRPLMVEAGTGVGKSFAYLIPAIRRVVENDERVIISTHTINLQEQLLEKDIPLLNAVIPEEFSAVLVKGRGNYISIRRMRQAAERADRLIADEQQRRALNMIEDWSYRTDDGTIATLPQLDRPEVWDHVQSDSNNCMGRRCPHYEDCFYQRARRRMEHGDILICNHALFFSDLALRQHGVGFLPKYHHVILDEAHTVEDVAADHFGISLPEGRVWHLLRLLHDSRRGKGFLSALHLKNLAVEPMLRAVQMVVDASHAAEDFFSALHEWYMSEGGKSGRMRHAGVIDNPISDPFRRLARELTLVKDQVEREADAFELTSYAARVQSVADQSEQLVAQALDGCVYFVEVAERSRGSMLVRGRPRVTLRCAAVDVSPVLREHLFAAGVSVVMTSATLAAVPGDFSLTSARLGCEHSDAVALDTPFDLARQMKVLIDVTMPAPDERGHTTALADRIERIVRSTDGGTFVLFTSFASLQAAADLVEPALREAGHPVLVHGRDGPPGLMLQRFRENTRSVLFGTASFWQGVDVRGDGLRCVIITRLPFEVPDRPIVEARRERIASEGGNPFRDDQLPRAVIKFRQGIGRLIRSATDRGIIAVLDARIASRPYGRQFRAAFPPDAEVIGMEDL